jgi:hypothetical protein
LSDLLGHEDRLVAHLEPLPFQEGRALATITEGSTELVEAPSEELATRQVLMAEEGDDVPSSPSARLTGYQKTKALPMLLTRTTPNAMRGVPGTELVRFVEGGPTSAYVLHNANSTLNSPCR